MMTKYILRQTKPILISVLLIAHFTSAGNCIRDNFNLNDGSLNKNWVKPAWSGTPVQIVGNCAYSPNGHSVYNEKILSDSIFCMVILKNFNIGGLWICTDTLNLTGFRVAIIPTSRMRLSKWNGTEEVLRTRPIKYELNDTLKIFKFGENIICKINSTTYIEIQDNSFEYGFLGIYEQGGLADDFYGGPYSCLLKPTINLVTSNPCYIGKTIHLYGTNFMSTRGIGCVIIGNRVIKNAKLWNDDSIFIDIPKNFAHGYIPIKVVNNKGDTSTTDTIRVLKPRFGW